MKLNALRLILPPIVMSLTACAHTPVPSPAALGNTAPQLTSPMLEFEITHADGSRAFWTSNGGVRSWQKATPFTKFSVVVRPRLDWPDVSDVAVEVTDIRMDTHTVGDAPTRSTLHLPTHVTLAKQCTLVKGSACEVHKGGKVLLSVRWKG